jgi:hypothetical protein
MVGPSGPRWAAVAGHHSDCRHCSSSNRNVKTASGALVVQIVYSSRQRVSEDRAHRIGARRRRSTLPRRALN